MGSGSYFSFSWIGMIFNFVITVAIIIGVLWLVICLMRRSGANDQVTFCLVSTTLRREILPVESFRMY